MCLRFCCLCLSGDGLGMPKLETCQDILRLHFLNRMLRQNNESNLWERRRQESISGLEECTLVWGQGPLKTPEWMFLLRMSIYAVCFFFFFFSQFMSSLTDIQASRQYITCSGSRCSGEAKLFLRPARSDEERLSIFVAFGTWAETWMVVMRMCSVEGDKLNFRFENDSN